MLGELNGIMKPTLREKIDKSIVGKLIKAKVNFGLGHPVKKILKCTNELDEKLYKLMSLLWNFTNQSLENFREGEST